MAIGMNSGADVLGTSEQPRWMSLSDVLAQHAECFGSHTAVVCGEFRADYDTLAERVGRVAGVLRAEGVAVGERVLWMGQNCHRVLELLLACSTLGAVFCPVNWRQTPEELAFVLNDLDPSVVVWEEDTIGEQVRAARTLAGGAASWIQADGTGPDSYEGHLAADGDALSPSLALDPTAPVLILYTAAFEGQPNGAMVTPQAIVLQGLMVAMLQDLDAGYAYLNCGPLFHAGTLWQTTATFLVGGKNVFTRRADPEEMCRLIDAEGCNGAMIAGPTLQRIVELSRERSYNLRSLRMPPVVTAAGSVPEEWWEMVGQDDSPWGRNPFGYGQTEFMGLVTFNAFGVGGVGRHGRPGSVVRLRVVGPDDRDVPAGQVGEIVARGPVVTAGYFRRPELNAVRMREGWYHTNDLGRFEADGTFTFVGPKGRLIKSGVENIYPVEVEQCIASHPMVADCAVIGVPDPDWVQSVCAVVALVPGGQALEQEIIEYARTRIASYKKPKRVVFAEELPRKDGAVDYDELDRRFGGGGYPGQDGASYRS